MKNKKGVELLNFTLRILVMVIVAIFLVILVVKSWKTFIGDPELERAEKELQTIVSKVKLVKDSKQNEELLVFPIENWFLKTFKFGTPIGECFGDISCLCICDDYQCSKRKKCEGFDFDFEINEVYDAGVLIGEIEQTYEFKENIEKINIFQDGSIIKIKRDVE